MTIDVADVQTGGAKGRGAALQGLRRLLGERLTTSQAVREQHGNTLTWIKNQPPDAVAFPDSTQEVVEIVRLCAEHRLPIIPFGVGTSLEGHLNAPFGGVSLDFARMNQMLALHEPDLDCVVQPGITRKQLNDTLRGTGLFFAVDPGADASLGGMAATRASGTNAVRYGTMRENVLNLTAVMADGSVVRTARRARKSAAGYDLTHLLVGSEGTLGVITELTVRLFGVPDSILAAVCPFATLEGACNATIAAVQLGLGLARIELLDELQIKACNAHSRLSLPEVPTLFLEFHGTQVGAREQVDIFAEIAAGEGGGAFDWAEKPEDRTRLWQARHDAYFACRTLRPGADGLATDVCVPISGLAECVRETQADIRELGLVAPIVGHVGDGNFHAQPMFDMSDADEVRRVETFLERLAKRALRMDGTCTGEHGVGTGKMKYLLEEHGSGLAAMAAIKRSLDPLNILNPGKIVAV